jgi:hypothetical protein
MITGMSARQEMAAPPKRHNLSVEFSPTRNVNGDFNLRGETTREKIDHSIQRMGTKTIM